MEVKTGVLTETPTTMISWRGIPIDLALAVNGDDERFNALYDTMDVLIPLSRMARYNGHTSDMYTVLAHTIAGHMTLKRRVAVHDLCGAFLIHDFHEAFIGDITYPAQMLLNHVAENMGYVNNMLNVVISNVKAHLDRCIAGKFKIPLYLHTLPVATLDVELRVAERKFFMRDPISANGKPDKVTIQCVHDAYNMTQQEQYAYVIDALAQYTV